MLFSDLFRRRQEPAPSELEAALSPLVKNEILLEINEGRKDLPPQASKFGGMPLLPRNFQWPLFAGEEDPEPSPLDFLCQISLADVKPYDRDGLLPERGILSFFYSCGAFRWGFDPEDKGCARVFYFEDTDELVPTPWPGEIEEEYIVPEAAISFTARPSYPSYEELEIHSPVNCEWEEYDACVEALGVDPEAEDHKLLGYAHVIQNEMLSECEKVSRGIYCGTGESWQNTPEDVKEDVCAHAADWTLLLQLSTLTVGDYEMMWGDCGMLYFYIKKEDLAARRFENAWFSLQCG